MPKDEVPASEDSGRGKVTFLIRDLDLGGAQRQLIELASGLQRTGWPVRVLVFYGGGGLEADLRARGVALQVLEKRGRWDVFGFGYRLLRALRSERPAILHSYLVTENVLSAVLRPFLPGTLFVWGVRSANTQLRGYGRLAELCFRLERKLSRFPDLIICNSRAGLECSVANGFPARRMVVIPNGVDSARFRPDPRARTEVRREWRVDDDEPLVGIVARLSPKKDHVRFLRAAASILREVPGARFVCVGDGPEEYRITLNREASELQLEGRLIWAGPRLDMPRVFNALDVLVSSSSWGEGFSNVVAEAMATGVPCVVTDAGDSGPLVGDTGWVCRAKDVDDLARALASALRNRDKPRVRGRLARERIVEQFGVDRLVLATSERFTELLARPR